MDKLFRILFGIQKFEKKDSNSLTILGNRILKSEYLNDFINTELHSSKYCILLSIWDFINSSWFISEKLPYYLSDKDKIHESAFLESFKKLSDKKATLNLIFEKYYNEQSGKNKAYIIVDYSLQKIMLFDGYNHSNIEEYLISDEEANEDKKAIFFHVTREFVEKYFDDNENKYQYLFSSIKGIGSSHEGILSIYTNRELPKESKLKFEMLTEKIFDYFSGYFHKKQNEIIKNQSLKSAIAAIMARNGSHNIGSHILSNISHKILNPLDVLFLIKYIQQRWDFLAQVASPDWPKWTLPMRFKGQIMRGFYEQRLLLNNIAESEGLHAQEDFEIKNLKNKISFEVLGRDGKPLKEDIVLAIPGGVTGVHAFYSILENIIRNTAKHAYNKESDEKIKDGLKITIQVKDNYENDYIEFFICDNWTKNKSLIDKISAAIKEPLIEDDGKLNYENWGIAEMKISAVYLRKEDYKELNPPLRENLTFRIEESDGECKPKGTLAFEYNNGKLAYHFAIPKPKEIGIEDNNLKSGFAKHGIYKIKTSEKEQDDFDFVIQKPDEDKNVDSIENNGEVNSDSLVVMRGGNIIAKHGDKKHWFDEYLLNGDEDNQVLKLNPVQIKKLKLFDHRIAKLLGVDPDTIKENEKLLHLFINPTEIGGGNGSGSKEKILKYYRETFTRELDKILRVYGEPEEINDIKELFKSNSNFIENPWIEFKRRFSDRQEALFEKIMVSWNTIYKNYNKYEEDIETIYYEGNYAEKKDSGSDVTNISWFMNLSIDKLDALPVFNSITINDGYPAQEKAKEKSILFKRHLSLSYEGCIYAEALSGAQSYFSLLKDPPKDDYSKIKLIYELLETALLKVTLIDERFENYLNSDNRLTKLFEAIKIYNIPQEAITKVNIPEANNRIQRILIIHIGVIDKIIEHKLFSEEQKKIDKAKSKTEKYEVVLNKITEIKGFFKENLFITTGKGRAEIPAGFKYIPFADIRSSIIKPYPEKYLLVKTLMKITEKPE